MTTFSKRHASFYSLMHQEAWIGTVDFRHFEVLVKSKKKIQTFDRCSVSEQLRSTNLSHLPSLSIDPRPQTHFYQATEIILVQTMNNVLCLPCQEGNRLHCHHSLQMMNSLFCLSVRMKVDPCIYLLVNNKPK